jgi:hypothetical protein
MVAAYTTAGQHVSEANVVEIKLYAVSNEAEAWQLQTRSFC